MSRSTTRNSARRRLTLIALALTTAAGVVAASSVPASAAPAPATPTSATTYLIACGYYSGTELTVRGNSGGRVLEVQCLLEYWGYSLGSSGVDGKFGAATEKAVRAFQSDFGLTVDGKVGVRTWAALRGE